MTNQPFYSRHAFRVLLAMVFLLPFAGLGARRALLTNKNDVKQWLPERYEETRVYQWFQRHFGGEEFVLVSWDGCTLDDQRLELLTRKLTAAIEHPPTDEPALFSELLTGPRIVERMTQPPLNLSIDEVTERLRGSLIGPDGRQTCLVLTLTAEGRAKARKSVDAIRQLAIDECGIPAADLHMGGPPVDNVAIDNAGEKSLMRLAGLSAIIGLTMSWWSLRSGRLVALVMIAGVYSLLASMSIVWFSQTPMNAILLSMPSLVYVAATSGAIHLANYYRDTVREEGAVGAPERAIRHGWLPLSLATGTTAIGLLSLAYSELAPIRMFGIYSAIGVVVSLVVLFFFLPAAFAMWPLWSESGRARRQRAMATADSAYGAAGAISGSSWPLSAAAPPVDRLALFWTRVGQWIVGHNGWVTIGCLALLVVTLCGVPRIETSVQMMRFFKRGAPLLTDYAWLERHLGELVPIEIVVRVDERQSGLNFLECLELVSTVQGEVDRLPEVGSSLSAVTFAPRLESKSTARAGGILGRLIKPEQRERDVRNRRLSEHRAEFLASDYVREADGELLWRISARVGALKNVDFAAFADELKRQIDPVLAAERERLAGVHGQPIYGVDIV
ncbi:MAG: MMPL family transporter [Pirellulales bacterium]